MRKRVYCPFYVTIGSIHEYLIAGRAADFCPLAIIADVQGLFWNTEGLGPSSAWKIAFPDREIHLESHTAWKTAMDRRAYQPLIALLLDEIKDFYGNRLVTFALFGSYARNELRNDSDLDLLLVVENLPKGRMNRVAEFLQVEKKVTALMSELSRQGLHPYFSPVFKTPEEATAGSPLFLDMTEEMEILFDRDNFFRRTLDAFQERLRTLGSKRVWVGKMWYWILKPDLKPGEKFSL